jgi:Trypsin-co-occurring domain 1
MAASRDGSSSKEPVILLEVRSATASGDLGPGRPTLEQFGRRASEIADGIAGIADEFRSRLERTMRKPDEGGWHADSIELRFDIAVQAEAGVVIARAVSGATFSAKLILKAQADSE